MTDDNIELSRRKILAGLGTIGVAGAGAGMGTTALFSDEESFANNSLTAGTLDLHVGWEEHYFDGKNRLDFSGSPLAKSDVSYVEGSPGSGRVTLPLAATSPQNGAAVSVPDQQSALDLLDVTEVDEYPSGFDPSSASGDVCNYLEDGSDASPIIIDLDDVKPGDFGEITFSLGLCDNPGYLWAQGCLQDANENGVNEPEASSSNEDQQEGSGDPPLKSGSGDGTVELLDAARAAMWYDNGDNLQSGGSGGGGNVDVVLLLDSSGSVDDVRGQIEQGAKDFVDLLGSMDAAAAIAFSGSPNTEIGLTELSDSTDRQSVKTAIEGFSGGGGGTDIDEGLIAAEDELVNNGRSGAQPWVILISDGQDSGYTDEANRMKDPDDSARASNPNFGIDIGVIGFGDPAFGGTDDTRLTDVAGRDPNTPNDDQGLYIDTTDSGSPTIQQAFSNLGGTVLTGEEVFFTGTLREATNALCPDPPSDYGLPLDGNRSTQFDEESGPVDSSDREEFASETRHDFGFAWWVPRSVGNQIQSDSATFSLSFYAVQSRNNDGSGSSSGASTPTTTTTTPNTQ